MLQLYNEFVEKVYKKCHDKYEKMGKDKMSRFTHIEGVCEMATYLANKYGVSVYKAQVAALLHDYYKYEDENEMAKFLSNEEIKECEKCKVLYHSYASSKQLKVLFGIEDKEIEDAIKNHVFGHPNMTKLEEIILISDYTEKNRMYSDCIKCRKMVMDGNLDLAIYESTKNTIDHLLSQNKKPHPLQYEVLKEYERKIK